ncbi:MAG TPA: tRNA lysidine(34) synthetase TilS, partial [Flavisolibacter sp.]|nr:tRNA lysidine(34) synthetase TilS [Flavisolibacter sp.]
EIEDFAGQNQLKWVEDSSNKLDKYTRNFLRNKLLPEVRDIFPSVEENILNNIERFRKTEVLYEELITRYKRKIGRHMPLGAYHLPVRWLQSKKDSSLIYEIIKDYGFTEKTVTEVIKLMDSESGRYISNESYKIIKHGKWLIIASNVSLYDPITIEENSHKILFDANLQLEIKKLAIEKFQDDKDLNLVQLDARFIEWPLLLRKWKQGDYFYPLGMKKKKKLARFLIDHKISKDEKEKVWVIESGKRIIWIVGMRLDDRFKITNTTKNILRITLSSL